MSTKHEAAGSNPAATTNWAHVWRVRKHLPERHGQMCRVLVVGRMNSVLVEFTDGYRVVTSRWFVRLVEAPKGARLF